jgi:hypothetical protein
MSPSTTARRGTHWPSRRGTHWPARGTHWKFRSLVEAMP